LRIADGEWRIADCRPLICGLRFGDCGSRRAGNRTAVRPDRSSHKKRAGKPALPDHGEID
jgi:hypothetical protein